LAQDKNNFDALEAMGQRLRAAALYRKSNDYYAQSIRQSQVKSSPAKRQAILSEMGANYLDVKAGKQAASVFERCLKEFPTSARKQEWMANLIRARTMTATKD
jgi:hypothetical protein